MKNGVFCDVSHVALVRTDVSEKFNASFITVARIDEQGTTLAELGISSQRATVASYC
jgi:hypothetical protein